MSCSSVYNFELWLSRSSTVILKPHYLGDIWTWLSESVLRYWWDSSRQDGLWVVISCFDCCIQTIEISHLQRLPPGMVNFASRYSEENCSCLSNANRQEPCLKEEYHWTCFYFGKWQLPRILLIMRKPEWIHVKMYVELWFNCEL